MFQYERHRWREHDAGQHAARRDRRTQHRHRGPPRRDTPGVGTASACSTGSATGSRTRCTRSAPSSSCSSPRAAATGHAGSFAVLDAYCRHMGGDLTQGSVKDGNVACPFHDWRWSPEGRCAGIPYAKRVPLRARTRAWTPWRRTGCCSSGTTPRATRHRPRSRSPRSRLSAPRTGATGSGRRCRSRAPTAGRSSTTSSDMAHFFYVHFAFPTYFKNIFEGPRRHPVHGVPRPPGHRPSRQRQPVRRRGQHAQVRGVLLRPLLHDQLAVERLQGHRRSNRSSSTATTRSTRTTSCCNTA